MSQQINLYNPALAPQVDVFSGRYLLLGLAGVLLLCALVWAALAVDLNRTVGHERQQSAALLQLQGEVTALAQQLAARKPAAELERELADVTALLGARHAVIERLDSGALGDTKGVSAYFRAFARQSTEGLWLTGFSVVGTGTDIEIEGRTVDADLVPAYLHKLRREELLRGHPFEALTVFQPAQSEDKSKPRYLEFRLSTTRAEGAGAAPVGAPR